MYYIKLKDLRDRTRFISHMSNRDIVCVFHYVPLHSAPAGKRYGRFVGDDVYTSTESNRLVRLPLYYGISDTDVDQVIDSAISYFE